LLKMKKVTIYTLDGCPHCNDAKELLKEKGVKFTEKNVSSDQRLAKEMIEKSGQRGTPVTIIDGKIIVGFDKEKLEEALK
tara:strand:+ start:698 stop:937 length:240 start_codon:yes stop_codon:yes gene_type:complete